MIDGINNAHGITPQSGKTVKKQEKTAQKDSASIFNNNGKEKIDYNRLGQDALNGGFNVPLQVTGWVSVEDTIREQGPLEYSGDNAFSPTLEGSIGNKNPIKLDYNRIGQAALEGGLKGALDE